MVATDNQYAAQFMTHLAQSKFGLTSAPRLPR